MMQNVSEGRKLYEKSVSVLKGSEDPYIQYAYANTYEIWGLAEIANNSVKLGKSYIEEVLKNKLS